MKEFEEKLLSSENENDSLKTQVANYQTTNLALEENLKVEKESSQQSASLMGQQLSDVNENLEQAQANAASLDEKNKVRVLQWVVLDFPQIKGFDVYIWAVLLKVEGSVFLK